MRRLCALALLAALGAALIVPKAAAQQTRVQWYDPITNKTYTTGPGTSGLPTREQFPPGTVYTLIPGAISAILADIAEAQNNPGVRANRDSTDVIDARGYNRIAFYLHPRATLTTEIGGGDADSLNGQLLAFQVRGHYSEATDSVSTFTMRANKPGNAVAGAGVRDSVGSLSDLIMYSGNVATYGMLRINALPSEKVVVVSNPGSVGDPRGILVWSGRLNEAQSASPTFVSFRLRCLRSYTNTTTGPTVRDSTTALPMFYRGDVLMWRE